MQYELAERKIVSRFILKPEHKDGYNLDTGIDSFYYHLATNVIKCVFIHDITIYHGNTAVMNLVSENTYKASDIRTTSLEPFRDLIDASYKEFLTDYVDTVRGHYFETIPIEVKPIYELDEIKEILSTILN